MNFSLLRYTLRIAAVFLLLLTVMLLKSGPIILAHSSLVSAVPSPDSRLEAAPSEIMLAFNERIENKGFSIRVYNRKGMPITETEAVMDMNSKVIRLQLPQLEDGGYTVTYRVLSADGHPIRASYVFTVGAVTDANIGYASASQLHEEHDISKNAGYWLIRGLYFLALLAVTGWVGLRLYAFGLLEGSLKRYETWRKFLLAIYFIALLLIAWKDYSKLSVDIAATERLPILFGTSIGLSYLLSFVITAVGFIVLGRRKLIDAGWVMLLLAAKGLNGHAMGYSIWQITYVLDVIHLTASSIWAGVLLAFAAFGLRRQAREMLAFFPILSQAALAAIILLVVSGLTTAALYTNGFSHLFETWWGRLMLAKTGLVILVIVTGGLLRWQIKKRKVKWFSASLLLDFTLFVVIIAITGIFTYLNPLAASGPLFWHENVKGVHIAAIITPNEPSEANQFNVSIGGSGLGSEGKGVKKILLRLHYNDNSDIAPIDVPLELVQTNGSPLSLYTYNYTAEGNYLLLPGKWTLEVRVLNESADEFVTEKTFYSEQKQQPDH